MAVQSIIKNTVNLDEPIKKQILTDVLGGSDNQAHRFEVELTRGGQAVSLSGATVYGYFIRPGDITVKLTGGVSGSTAYVVLNEHCYVTPGRFSFAMKVQVGEVLHTVLLYEGCVAVTQGEGVVDDGYTIPSLTEWMNNIRKANLLDNSDFRNPVNQRGGTSYTGNAYTIDRWRTYSATAEIAVNDGNVTLVTSALLQYLDIDPNKTYTAAVRTADGKTAVTSGIFASGFGNASIGIRCAVVNNYCRFLIDQSLGANGLLWAALYEGSYTADTLPAYVPKGYAAEFAECCRYYYVIGRYQTLNGFVTGSAKEAWVTAFLPAPMRLGSPTVETMPTVVLRGINGYSALTSSNSNGIAPTSAAVTAENVGTGHVLRIRFYFDSAIDTNNTPLSVFLNSKCALSADL